MKTIPNAQALQWAHKNITVWWIEFHDTSFTESWLLEVLQYLKAPQKIVYTNYEFSVHYLGLSDFLVEFSDEKSRDEYLEKLGSVNPDISDYQLPQSRGYFNTWGKSYALLWALRDFESHKDTKGLGYKWIIFNLSVLSAQWEVRDDTSGILRKS